MNPFHYGSIVRGNSFFNRQKEREHIVATLSGGNNVVLYAPRRFGKTSLIFSAIEQLEAQGFCCIYFDFMPVFSLESFVRLYSKALSIKQTNLQKFVQIFTSAVKSIRPVLSFDENGSPEFSIDFAGSTVNESVVSQLLDIPEKLAGANHRVLVFFDEFQEVEKLDSINFEGLLRSKVQQQRQTNYLFLGSKTHIMKELFNSKKRAFYNAALPMSISYLPENETIEYLRKGFSDSSIVLDNETALYIISVTSMIPHYIQQLASEIWQYMVNSCDVVTKEIVDECSMRLLAHKSDYYMELFDRQSQSRKQLLQALTKSGKNIFSASYIRTYNLPSAATLQRAAQGLVKDGIVDKINGEYFISDPFFKLFIKCT
ncbi:MAG: ATP-binding protein [Prevotellaceae bacterium]|jgi:AAA+ ATPase superfamily predicted ATPase|nr:ATP-binding protein [Prevotellaceae bacterium]